MNGNKGKRFLNKKDYGLVGITKNKK